MEAIRGAVSRCFVGGVVADRECKSEALLPIWRTRQRLFPPGVQIGSAASDLPEGPDNKKRFHRRGRGGRRERQEL